MKKSEKYLTHKEACEHLEISSATMNRLLVSKRKPILPAHKPMGRWRFYISELDDWIEKRNE